TLSLPFFVSRSGYAADVSTAALKDGVKGASVPNDRLLLIDYGTHLEVLVANLVLGGPSVRQAILNHAKLDRLASWRCVIQLNHLPSLKAPRGSKGRKGVQLTEELEHFIDAMRRAATCWNLDAKSETYTFDYFVDSACSKAFSHFFKTAVDL